MKWIIAAGLALSSVAFALPGGTYLTPDHLTSVLFEHMEEELVDVSIEARNADNTATLCLFDGTLRAQEGGEYLYDVGGCRVRVALNSDDDLTVDARNCARFCAPGSARRLQIPHALH